MNLKKRIFLRNGKPCLIRSTVLSDAPGLFALEHAIVDAGLGVVKYKDELPKSADAYQEELYSRFISRDNFDIALVAENEETKLVGEISLRRFSYRMLRHTGLLAMGVHPDMQGQGLGRALIETLLSFAKQFQDNDKERVLRIELYTRIDNRRAITLYRSVGFVVEGVRRGFLRTKEGNRIDDLIMALHL